MEVLPKKAQNMVIVYSVVALVGGLISCVLLWPYGAAIALLSIRFTGSLLVIAAAVLVHMRASDRAETSNERAVFFDQTQKLQTRESR